MRKYVLLPGCLLLVNALNRVLSYKLQLIDHEYLRVLAILFMTAVGFGCVALLITPLAIKSLDQSRKFTKAKAGAAGEWAWAAALYVGLFFLYHAIYIHGPEAVLPYAWRNPPERHGAPAPSRQAAESAPAPFSMQRTDRAPR